MQAGEKAEMIVRGCSRHG